MKRIVVAIFPVFVLSCGHSTSVDPAKSETTSITTIKDSGKKDETAATGEKIDSTLLMSISGEVLASIKTRNYKKLVSFIHSSDSILFSPYANIDMTDNAKFSASGLVSIAGQNKRVDWNTSWEDKPELMTVGQYFSKFVYDVDFLRAPFRSVNNFHSQGTDPNNIEELYPGCEVTEFFFPGFDKKYGGMDFRALRLVFKIYNNHPYLVAIVHDQWTP